MSNLIKGVVLWQDEMNRIVCGLLDDKPTHAQLIVERRYVDGLGVETWSPVDVRSGEFHSVFIQAVVELAHKTGALNDELMTGIRASQAAPRPTLFGGLARIFGIGEDVDDDYEDDDDDGLVN